MADGHNNDDQKTIFEAAKDSPVADAIPPEPFFVASKRLPELGRIRTTADPLIEKTEDFGGCGRAKCPEMAGGGVLNPIIPAHVLVPLQCRGASCS
jgi:hypothetical protein